MNDTKPQAPSGDPHSLESTAQLLERLRRGDSDARNVLMGRYLPALTRWAHGRLPASLQDLAATDDLVQNTLVRALNHLERFEPRREGAYLAYLRQILLNQIRDELRRAGRRKKREVELHDEIPDRAPSPLEQAIGQEALERFDAALVHLSDREQEAVILRLELGYTHAEIADAIGSPSANAARMLLTRALVKLAGQMGEP